MRCRVKEGAAYRDKIGRHHEAGAHVDVDEHEAAIIPWCLERVEENAAASDSSDESSLDEKIASSKPRSKSKSSQG